MSNNKISIVIVNYNSAYHLSNLIKSLKKHLDDVISDIQVIDNNSKEKFPLKFNYKKVFLYQNKSNLGFAKAVNQGILLTNSDRVLLLNPDSLVIDNSIKKLISFLNKRNSVAMVGGEILDPNGNKSNYTPSKFSLNFRLALFEFTIFKKFFPKNSISKKFKIQPSTITEVDSLCGAFVLFRKRINGKVLTFDENFFLYLEDLDFSIMIRTLGYKLYYLPKSRIHHIGGASSNSKYKIVHKYWYLSRKYFFKKYLGRFSNLILGIIFSIEEYILKLIEFVDEYQK